MAVYFASYITRNSFAVMAVRVCSDMQVAKSTLAVVITGMTVCYGIGQLINGRIGDKVKSRYMISLGLLFSGITNFIFSWLAPVSTAVSILF